MLNNKLKNINFNKCFVVRCTLYVTLLIINLEVG